MPPKSNLPHSSHSSRRRSMDEAQQTWEPLPPRKRAKAPPREAEPASATGTVTAAQQMEENIAARAKQSHAHTTLQSKDGCAGEFYEYLDHTADVQCHSWGKTLVEAFENMAPCMLNYQTDIALIQLDPSETQTMTVAGHDMESLLYNYMNELLFKFITDSFCAAKVTITSFDREKFALTATLEGDIFDASKHSSGTEIKAITYSAMQIHESEDRCDLFVIVDI